MTAIRFRRLVFDPERDADALAGDPAFRLPLTAHESSRYVIVRRDRPRAADVLRLRAQGTRVLEHLDGAAYLCATST